MDIMMPPLEQQPSPAPWLARAKRIDLSRLVADVLAAQPDAKVDEVVTHLAEHRQVQASRIIVSMLLYNQKQQKATENPPRASPHEPPTVRRRLADVIQEWTSKL